MELKTVGGPSVNPAIFFSSRSAFSQPSPSTVEPLQPMSQASRVSPTDQIDRPLMRTGFSHLPYELRLQIFEFVAEDDCQPRVVEIYRKGDQLYSKTAPPPLLHACRESREFILKIYKPWLPQFKGTASHRPWVNEIQQHRGRPQFSLENVYASLEHDTLLIRDERTLWRLGSLECDHLRHLGINVAGGVRPSELLKKLRILKRLEYLYIFDADNRVAEDYKVDYIKLQVNYEAELDRERPKNENVSKYIPPKVVVKSYPPPPNSWGAPRSWTSYTYLKKEGLLQIALVFGRAPPKSPEMPRKRGRPKLPENAEEEIPRKRAQTLREFVPKPSVNAPSRANNPPYRKPVPGKLRPTPIKKSKPKPEPEPASPPSSPSITTDDEIQIQLQLREELDDAEYPDVDEDTNAEGDISTSNKDITPASEVSDSLLETESSGETSDVYVVEKFLAERQTPQGLEILVKWEGYPNEEDFTWETAKSLAETVPSLLEAWNDREDHADDTEEEEETDACQIAEVEKILSRRKFNGVPHYLVKWRGWDDMKDRTWEPCERLRVDTPFHVEEFEQKQKRGKRKL